MAKNKLNQRIDALRLAKDIGCAGAHQMDDGTWMPCSSHEEMERISNIAETSRWRTVVPGYKKDDKTRRKGRRKMRRRDGWERLREAPIRGIATLADGSLVSSLSFGSKNINPCWDGYVMQGMKKGKKGKLVPNCVPVKAKSLDCCGSKGVGPEFVRDNDPDVFLDPQSAQSRARQLGCIGISRRVSKNGRTVWMPCSNMSDYANASGSTALGRRNISKRRENETRQAIRTVLRQQEATVKRKKSIHSELQQN